MALPISVANNDSSDSASLCGPFSHNGDLYVLSNMMGDYINVFKSSDGGDTYTPIQHDLGPFSSSLPTSSFDVALDGSNIITVYEDGTNLRVRTFSMASDTWGAASAAGPISNTGEDTTPDVRVRVVRVPSGDLFVFYTEWLTTNQTINYSKYSGGVWGANTILVASSGTIFNFLGPAFQDSNGLIHVYYRKAATDTANAALYHATLTTAGVATVNNLVSATLTTFPAGRAFEFGGKQNLIHYNGSTRTGIWVGDSLGATPAWSFTLLNTAALAGGVVDIGPMVNEAGAPHYGAKGFGFVSGGVAYVIWRSTSDNGSGGDFSTNRIYMATNSGSGWSAPVLLYDNFLLPGPTVGIPDNIFAITAAVVGSTLYVFSCLDCGGLELTYRSAAVTLPIAITCGDPPSGYVLVAYSHQFPVTGGTPPYTYNLRAGDSLPPGLTLNAATGIISGLPVLAGLFTFTVHVVDSLLNAAFVECSIRIFEVTPGGGGSDSDCTGPPMFQLRPCRIADLDARDIHWQETVDAPIPADGVDPPSYYFTLGLNLMGLWQTPVQDLPGAVTYAYEPPLLVAGGDTPLVPEEYHESLVKFATVWLRLKEGGQEFQKTAPLLKEFLEDAAKLANYVRLRSLASKYDSLPAEITTQELARILKEILPTKGRNDGDKPTPR